MFLVDPDGAFYPTLRPRPWGPPGLRAAPVDATSACRQTDGTRGATEQPAQRRAALGRSGAGQRGHAVEPPAAVLQAGVPGGIDRAPKDIRPRFLR